MATQAKKKSPKRPTKAKRAAPKRVAPKRVAPKQKTLLLVGTKKGAFFVRSDGARAAWKVSAPHHLGSMAHHMVLDPRDRKTLLLAARTGHLGPTVFRSEDLGETWTEATRPPAFRKADEAQGRARVLNHVFWLTPGHPSEPGVWYAGSSPQGLFRSEDGGRTWDGVLGLNEHPDLDKWTGGAQDGTPDGPKLHSVIVDPRDKHQLYVGMSSGGCFESRDRGETWTPWNKGCAALFQPDPDPAYGHDPHCVVQHPADPDRFYQQNHCGIYRIDRDQMERWTRIGDHMPRDVGDIGFPIVVHPRDPDTAWVFPMDGTDVWPRTSVGGKPAAYVTRDAGATWKRQDKGFPRSNAWWTVFRQAFVNDAHDPVGLYFGTTGGQLWGSIDEGKTFRQIATDLPQIYSITVAAP